MKETHFILRIPRVTTRDVFVGGAASFPGVEAAAAHGPSVEVDEIDRRDITALTRDPTVVAGRSSDADEIDRADCRNS